MADKLELSGTFLELTERLKEIECLYGLLDLARHEPIVLDAFLNEVVKLLPPAFLWVDELSAQIQYKNIDCFAGKAIQPTITRCRPLVVQGQTCGFVQVGYDLSDAAEMFLYEEERLLEAFSFELSQVLERHTLDEELRLLASVFENSHVSIMICNSENRILKVNQAFTHATGYRREEIMGKDPRFLSSNRQSTDFYEVMWDGLLADNFWSGEVWNRRKDGEIYAEILSISVVRDDRDEPKYFIGVFTDISSIKQNEAKLIRLAHYDALTQLPNRRLFDDRLSQALVQVKRSQRPFALCFIDLNKFKPINDEFGHEVGDQVLIEIAQRLKSNLRESDSLARYGGDEFLLLLQGIESEHQVQLTLDRIISHIEQPIDLSIGAVRVSASCGVVVYPQAGLHEEDNLIALADKVMYSIKHNQGSRIGFWRACSPTTAN